MADSLDNVTIIAVVGGLLPAIFWLWFWLREDKAHPEPARLIIACFIAGIISTAVALPIERYVETVVTQGLLLYFVWAIIEEIVKFIAAYFVAFSDPNYDEPNDAMIYMITVALGFAALENGLFLIKAFETGGTIGAFVTGNIRFLGATLVHIVSSAVIGGAIALSYYKNLAKKIGYFIVGLITAGMLHGLFNYIIIKDSDGQQIFATLLVLWFSVILIFLLFEKVKHLKKQIN
jgi:RsiW-degrading membrane proteinase PrsW (M82 family)